MAFISVRPHNTPQTTTHRIHPSCANDMNAGGIVLRSSAAMRRLWPRQRQQFVQTTAASRRVSSTARRLRLQPTLMSSIQASLIQQPRIHRQVSRKIHFLPLLGLWGAKHLTAWTIYNACKNYGWPRVYRRLLEQNRAMMGSNQANIQRAIRMAIEAPPRFAAQLSQQFQILEPLLQRMASHAEPRVPSFLVAIAKYIVHSQKPVKVVQDMMNAASGKK